MTARQAERRRAARMRGLRGLLVVLVACAVGLFFLIVPFRALLPARALPPRGEGEMRLHFLSVGQGDCTIVEFPDGDALVVDGGDGSFAANDALVRYLKGLDVSSLTLIATHADADHYAGLTEVLRVFGAEQVYLPVIASSESAYRRFLDAVEQEGCRVDTLVRYDVIARPSGAYAVCISPHAAGETDENEASVALFLYYEGVRILLSSDMSAVRERALLEELSLTDAIFDSGEYAVRLRGIDLLKVAHHGSAGASCAEWLTYLSPATAVISCGAGNSYRHPSQDTLARLAQVGADVYRTDACGNVLVTVSGGGMTVTFA